MQAFLFDFWPEYLLSKEQAQELLAPYTSSLASCWRYAWKGWENQPAEFRGQLTTTTRAGIVQNLAVSQARLVFADIPEIRVCEELGFFKLYLSDKAVVRLKRVNRDYLARNVKTEQQRDYYWHHRVRGIKDGLTRITVGYTLDETETAIDKIVASLQWGLENLIWWFSIEGEAQIQQIPIPPIAPEDTPRIHITGVGGSSSDRKAE
jgi:hypothetical protein